MVLRRPALGHLQAQWWPSTGAVYLCNDFGQRNYKTFYVYIGVERSQLMTLIKALLWKWNYRTHLTQECDMAISHGWFYMWGFVNCWKHVPCTTTTRNADVKHVKQCFCLNPTTPLVKGGIIVFVAWACLMSACLCVHIPKLCTKYPFWHRSGLYWGWLT